MPTAKTAAIAADFMLGLFDFHMLVRACRFLVESCANLASFRCTKTSSMIQMNLLEVLYI